MLRGSNEKTPARIKIQSFFWGVSGRSFRTFFLTGALLGARGPLWVRFVLFWQPSGLPLGAFGSTFAVRRILHFIWGFILFSAPIHVVSGDKMMLLGGPSKIIFFQKWTHGGARFGEQCIKRGCQQLRSLFLFDVLPFCEKLQMCDFWLFHFNEITAAKIKISSFFVRF